MNEAPKLNPLIPELLCTSIKTSVAFYTEVLGFKILYQREERRFAMLERQGAQIMLDEFKPGDPGSWHAAPMEAPFGRGMNLDIHTDNVEDLYARVQASGAKIFLPIKDAWYRADNIDLGSRQFIVLDPDGYLLRFSERIGTRPTQSNQ
ncbi:MAG: VOC family protein [Alphaproteobacteria bacterium]|nr:VOC family protein [Alphaproteobacteria bacterium]